MTATPSLFLSDSNVLGRVRADGGEGRLMNSEGFQNRWVAVEELFNITVTIVNRGIRRRVIWSWGRLYIFPFLEDRWGSGRRGRGGGDENWV